MFWNTPFAAKTFHQMTEAMTCVITVTNLNNRLKRPSFGPPAGVLDYCEASLVTGMSPIGMDAPPAAASATCEFS